jgi:hypothetical protein
MDFTGSTDTTRLDLKKIWNRLQVQKQSPFHPADGDSTPKCIVLRDGRRRSERIWFFTSWFERNTLMNTAFMLMTSAWIAGADPVPCDACAAPTPACTPSLGLLAKIKAKLHAPCDPCAAPLIHKPILSCDPCSPGLFSKLKARLHHPVASCAVASPCPDASPCAVAAAPAGCALPPVPGAVTPTPAVETPKEMPKPKDAPKPMEEKKKEPVKIEAALPGVSIPMATTPF